MYIAHCTLYIVPQALYDTPGLIVPSQLTTLLTTAELADVVPKKRGEARHFHTRTLASPARPPHC